MNKLISFCSKLLKKHKKHINSIWFDKDSLSILVSENKKEIENYAKNLLKKQKLKITLEINPIEAYFNKILKGDNRLYAEIGSSSILYDPNHFMDPIQEMIKEGHMLGTKESLLKKFITINEHFKEIERKKHTILDNIYMSIVEASQAVLIEKFNTFCIPKQVPIYLNKYLVKKRKLEKKYLNYCTEIIKTFKAIEHKKRTIPSGKELDILQKNADLFRERIGEILTK